jgi:hypothetical protein
MRGDGSEGRCISKEVMMPNRLIEASDVMRECRPTLVPALSECVGCRRMQMIAAPVLEACPDCGCAQVVRTTQVAVQTSGSDSEDRLPNAA